MIITKPIEDRSKFSGYKIYLDSSEKDELCWNNLCCCCAWCSNISCSKFGGRKDEGWPFWRLEVRPCWEFWFFNDSLFSSLQGNGRTDDDGNPSAYSVQFMMRKNVLMNRLMSIEIKEKIHIKILIFLKFGVLLYLCFSVAEWLRIWECFQMLEIPKDWWKVKE